MGNRDTAKKDRGAAPGLLDIMEVAGIVAQDGDERPAAWAAAFDAWLRTRQARHRKWRVCARTAWKRLLAYCRLPPWQIQGPQIQAWVEDMCTQGLRRGTVENYLGFVRSFYDHMLEPPSVGESPPPAANPARTFTFTGPPDVETGIWLCTEEVEALLGAVDRERCVLGKRDYALLLVLLHSAQDAVRVRELRWDAIEVQGGAAWVHWRRGKRQRRELLAPEAWEAILAYLEASGRLAGMNAADFVFAPFDFPAWSRNLAQGAWVSGRPLTFYALNHLLLTYLRWTELAVERLTCHDLRHTAVMLRLRQGASVEAIHNWLAYDRLRTTRRYIKTLEARRPTRERRLAARRARLKGPCRRLMTSLQHGYYARLLPPDELQAALQAPVGLDEITDNLRVMLDRLYRQVGGSDDWAELVRLMDVYGRGVYWLDRLERLGREAAQGQDEDLERRIRKLVEALGGDEEGDK